MKAEIKWPTSNHSRGGGENLFIPVIARLAPKQSRLIFRHSDQKSSRFRCFADAQHDTRGYKPQNDDEITTHFNGFKCS